MKWLLFIVVIAALCVKGLVLEDPIEDVILTVAHYIVNRCEEVGGKQLLGELAATADEANNCVERNANNTLNSIEDICAGYDVDCGLPVLDKFKSCLKPEEEDVLSAVHRVAKGILEYICEDNLHVLTAAGSDACLTTVAEEAKSACVEKLKESVAAKGIDGVFLKNNVCSDVQSLTTCVLGVVKDKCSEFPDVRVVIEKAFDIVNDECNE